MNARDMVAPVAAEITRRAAEVEETRKLPDDLVTALGRAGLLSLYTPKQFGGLELPLPDALSVVEEVARLDASTGWAVALGFGAGVFTAGLAEDVAMRVLGLPGIIAGAPGIGLEAVEVEDGYRLAGQWPFNSGAPNASWVAVAVPVFEGGQPRMGEGGPEMIFALLPASDVEVVDTWHVMGLKGTGTQHLRVDGLFVPRAFTGRFSLPAGPRSTRETPLARLPFTTTVALAQVPPVCLGIARRAIDEFRAFALGKVGEGGSRLSDQPRAQEGLARAEARLEAARAYWYGAVEAAWEAAVAGEELTQEARLTVRLASVQATENAVEAVDRLFRLGGTSAIYTSCALERCWRDIHAAGQHLQVQEGRWEDAGRVMFGLDPLSPWV